MSLTMVTFYSLTQRIMRLKLLRNINTVSTIYFQPTSVRTSTSLPSLPRQRDVKTQTESLVGNTQFRCRPSKRPFSSLNIHRQYRVSPKTKPAPPPPPSSSLYPHHDPSLDTPSWSEEKPPPIPPPPPSRSPPPLHAYCDNPSSFSYGYTSPISTLNLDSSFTFSSPTSSKVSLRSIFNHILEQCL